MGTLMVDFITSLDGYGAAEGWPGFWGMEGPEYLGWLEQQEEHTTLMGATTYRLMSGFAESGEAGLSGMTAMPKVVFSSTLSEPLSWANTRVVAGDAVTVVFDKRCSEAPILSRLETNPPAGFYVEPPGRQKAVIRDPERLRKLSI